MRDDLHPFKLLRNSFEPRVTMQRAADLCEIGLLDIVRCEQSLFSLPLSVYTNYLSDTSGTTVEELNRQYSEWARIHRRKCHLPSPVGLTLVESIHRTPIVSYFQHVWPNCSQQAISRNLCIHPASLLRYLRGVQSGMPGQMYLALLDAGLSMDDVRYLNDLGERWFMFYGRI